MRPGEASVTAQRVAAHRLSFERVVAPFGDPGADEQLAADVAGGIDVTGSRMTKYLAARTSFFDRITVGALDVGIEQVVVTAAGYDGRPLRYAKPGVRWFELDHPDTQRDKRARLERLGMATGHIAFAAADFAIDDVAAALAAAGHDAARPSLFLCEGVAVYLEYPVLASLLSALRRRAAPGSTLAISLSVTTGGAAQQLRRAGFQQAVAAMGEPARTNLSADGADALFTTTGWRAETDERRARARSAGLVIASPR